MKSRPISVLHLLPKPTIGGIQLVTIDICKHLDPEQYQCIMVFIGNRDENCLSIPSHIKAYFLNESNNNKKPFFNLRDFDRILRIHNVIVVQLFHH